jgi:hypothetical protein
MNRTSTERQNVDGAPSTELPPTSSYQQGGRDLATYEHFVRSESERGRPTNEYVLVSIMFCQKLYHFQSCPRALIVHSSSLI